MTNQGYWLGYSSIVAEPDWFFGYMDRLTAVTVEGVQRMANTVLARRNRTVGHYLPQGL